MSDLKCKFFSRKPSTTRSVSTAGPVSPCEGQQLWNIPISSSPRQDIAVQNIQSATHNIPASLNAVQNVPLSTQGVPVASIEMYRPSPSATTLRDSSELQCKLVPLSMGSISVGASGLAALAAEGSQQLNLETGPKQESEQSIVIQQQDTTVSEQDTVQDTLPFDQDTVQQDVVNVKSEKEVIQLDTVISMQDTTFPDSVQQVIDVLKSEQDTIQQVALKPEEDITQQDTVHSEQDTMLQDTVQDTMLQDTVQSEQDAIQQVALQSEEDTMLEQATMQQDTEQQVTMQQATIQQAIRASEDGTTLQDTVQSELANESALLQYLQVEERATSQQEDTQHVSTPAYLDGLEDYRVGNLTQPVGLGSFCVEDKERDFCQEVSDDEIDADEMDADEPDISEIDIQLDSGKELQPPTYELQPSVSEFQPSISKLQPSISELQSELQSSVCEFQPPTSELQQSICKLQPSCKLQPLISELQPSFSERQSSVHEFQPPACELQPSICKLQTSVSELQPSVSKLQPSAPTCELQPSICEHRPSVCELQTSLSEIQPSVTEPAFGSPFPSDSKDHIKVVERDLTPVLKRQKLSCEEWTVRAAIQTSDKAIQVPCDEQLADDGYETVFQTLPEECARQHALIPNVPPCRLSEADGLHSDERGDPPDDGGGWGVHVTAERSLEQSPSPNCAPPQTALCDIDLAPDQLVPEDSWNRPNTNQTLYPDTHVDTKSNKVTEQDTGHLGLSGVSKSCPPCEGASVAEQGGPHFSSVQPPAVTHHSCFNVPTHTNQGTLGLGNLSKPRRIRLGLSKRQKCRSLHDN